jgi:prolyl-tRNA synthetase
VVLLPIFRKEEDERKVMEYTRSLADALTARTYNGSRIRVEIDDRDTGGARAWDWIKKGIPLRAEIGPRDMEKDCVFLGRRDEAPGKKVSLGREDFISTIDTILDDIQNNLFNRALAFKRANTVEIDDTEAFKTLFTSPDENSIHGGFAMAHWCGSAECEAKIKEDLSVTIRCIPFDSKTEQGSCICCGNASGRRVLFAKAY